MSAPFVVFSLPRSRSVWLSYWLTYGAYYCAHDSVAKFRTLADAQSWLSQDYTGTVETSGSYWWRLLQKYRPDAQVAVVLRPVKEVYDSLQQVGDFDNSLLLKNLEQNYRKLEQLACRLPNVYVIEYKDFADEQRCSELFEHCLPYAHDSLRWKVFNKLNLQQSMSSQIRYALANKPQMELLMSVAKQHSLMELTQSKPFDMNGVSIKVEPFAQFLRDGVALFREHAAAVGETTDSYLSKNIPLWQTLEATNALRMTVARQNGRIIGYLATTESPSLEYSDKMFAYQSLRYASPYYPGLGLKLTRAAIADSIQRGNAEVFAQTGTRGEGSRVSSLYKRCGFVESGMVYRLNLREQ